LIDEAGNIIEYPSNSGSIKTIIFDYSQIEIISDLIFNELITYNPEAFNYINFSGNILNYINGSSEQLWDVIIQFYHPTSGWIPLSREPGQSIILSNSSRRYTITWDIESDINIIEEIISEGIYTDTITPFLTGNELWGSWGRFSGIDVYMPIIISEQGSQLFIRTYHYNNGWTPFSNYTTESLSGQFKIADVNNDGLDELIITGANAIKIIYFDIDNFQWHEKQTYLDYNCLSSAFIYDNTDKKGLLFLNLENKFFGKYVINSDFSISSILEAEVPLHFTPTIIECIEDYSLTNKPAVLIGGLMENSFYSQLFYYDLDLNFREILVDSVLGKISVIEYSDLEGQNAIILGLSRLEIGKMDTVMIYRLNQDLSKWEQFEIKDFESLRFRILDILSIKEENNEKLIISSNRGLYESHIQYKESLESVISPQLFLTEYYSKSDLSTVDYSLIPNHIPVKEIKKIYYFNGEEWIFLSPDLYKNFIQYIIFEASLYGLLKDDPTTGSALKISYSYISYKNKIQSTLNAKFKTIKGKVRNHDFKSGSLSARSIMLDATRLPLKYLNPQSTSAAYTDIDWYNFNMPNLNLFTYRSIPIFSGTMTGLGYAPEQPQHSFNWLNEYEIFKDTIMKNKLISYSDGDTGTLSERLSGQDSGDINDSIYEGEFTNLNVDNVYISNPALSDYYDFGEMYNPSVHEIYNPNGLYNYYDLGSGKKQYVFAKCKLVDYDILSDNGDFGIYERNTIPSYSVLFNEDFKSEPWRSNLENKTFTYSSKPTDDSYIILNSNINHGKDSNLIVGLNKISYYAYNLSLFPFYIDGHGTISLKLTPFSENPEVVNFSLCEIFNEDTLTGVNHLPRKMTPFASQEVYHDSFTLTLPEDFGKQNFTGVCIEGNSQDIIFYSKEIREYDKKPLFIFKGLRKFYQNFNSGYIFSQIGYELFRMSSPKYNRTAIDPGTLILVEFKAETRQGVELVLMDNGTAVATYTLVPYGNTNYDRQLICFKVDNSLFFDQIKIYTPNYNFLDYKGKLIVYNIKFLKNDISKNKISTEDLRSIFSSWNEYLTILTVNSGRYGIEIATRLPIIDREGLESIQIGFDASILTSEDFRLPKQYPLGLQIWNYHAQRWEFIPLGELNNDFKIDLNKFDSDFWAPSHGLGYKFDINDKFRPEWESIITSSGLESRTISFGKVFPTKFTEAGEWFSNGTEIGSNFLEDDSDRKFIRHWERPRSLITKETEIEPHLHNLFNVENIIIDPDNFYTLYSEERFPIFGDYYKKREFYEDYINSNMEIKFRIITEKEPENWRESYLCVGDFEVYALTDSNYLNYANFEPVNDGPVLLNKDTGIDDQYFIENGEQHIINFAPYDAHNVYALDKKIYYLNTKINREFEGYTNWDTLLGMVYSLDGGNSCIPIEYSEYSYGSYFDSFENIIYYIAYHEYRYNYPYIFTIDLNTLTFGVAGNIIKKMSYVSDVFKFNKGERDLYILYLKREGYYPADLLLTVRKYDLILKNFTDYSINLGSFQVPERDYTLTMATTIGSKAYFLFQWLKDDVHYSPQLFSWDRETHLFSNLTSSDFSEMNIIDERPYENAPYRDQHTVVSNGVDRLGFILKNKDGKYKIFDYHVTEYGLGSLNQRIDEYLLDSEKNIVFILDRNRGNLPYLTGFIKGTDIIVQEENGRLKKFKTGIGHPINAIAGNYIFTNNIDNEKIFIWSDFIYRDSVNTKINFENASDTLPAGLDLRGYSGFKIAGNVFNHTSINQADHYRAAFKFRKIPGSNGKIFVSVSDNIYLLLDDNIFIGDNYNHTIIFDYDFAVKQWMAYKVSSQDRHYYPLFESPITDNNPQIIQPRIESVYDNPDHGIRLISLESEMLMSVEDKAKFEIYKDWVSNSLNHGKVKYKAINSKENKIIAENTFTELSSDIKIYYSFSDDYLIPENIFKTELTPIFYNFSEYNDFTNNIKIKDESFTFLKEYLVKFDFEENQNFPNEDWEVSYWIYSSPAQAAHIVFDSEKQSKVFNIQTKAHEFRNYVHDSMIGFFNRFDTGIYGGSIEFWWRTHADEPGMKSSVFLPRGTIEFYYEGATYSPRFYAADGYFYFLNPRNKITLFQYKKNHWYKHYIEFWQDKLNPDLGRFNWFIKDKDNGDFIPLIRNARYFNIEHLPFIGIEFRVNSDNLNKYTIARFDDVKYSWERGFNAENNKQVFITSNLTRYKINNGDKFVYSNPASKMYNDPLIGANTLKYHIKNYLITPIFGRGVQNLEEIFIDYRLEDIRFNFDLYPISNSSEAGQNILDNAFIEGRSGNRYRPMDFMTPEGDFNYDFYKNSRFSDSAIDDIQIPLITPFQINFGNIKLGEFYTMGVDIDMVLSIDVNGADPTYNWAVRHRLVYYDFDRHCWIDYPYYLSAENGGYLTQVWDPNKPNHMDWLQNPNPDNFLPLFTDGLNKIHIPPTFLDCLTRNNFIGNDSKIMYFALISYIIPGPYDNCISADDNNILYYKRANQSIPIILNQSVSIKSVKLRVQQ
ncbi:MAG: hypothetical protein ACTSPW_11285, partial [Promethearchaeota archaeon]